MQCWDANIYMFFLFSNHIFWKLKPASSPTQLETYSIQQFTVYWRNINLWSSSFFMCIYISVMNIQCIYSFHSPSFDISLLYYAGFVGLDNIYHHILPMSALWCRLFYLDMRISYWIMFHLHAIICPRFQLFLMLYLRHHSYDSYW